MTLKEARKIIAEYEIKWKEYPWFAVLQQHDWSEAPMSFIRHLLKAQKIVTLADEQIARAKKMNKTLKTQNPGHYSKAAKKQWRLSETPLEIPQRYSVVRPFFHGVNKF